ncbi:DNA-binding transcription factor yap1 [Microbotryomycetes sp. JL221]|nr:DNA-binding transcription factor yap1 [Microbotryomycetes sp. JL221]
MSSTQSPVAARDQLVSAIERSLANHGKITKIERMWDMVMNRPTESQQGSTLIDDHNSSGDEASTTATSTSRKPTKRGRKRKQDDVELIDSQDLDLDTKRKLQNRAAQRSFRERKERHVADLERKVVDQTDQISALTTLLFAENQNLRTARPIPPTSNGTLPSPQSSLHASPPLAPHEVSTAMKQNKTVLSLPAATAHEPVKNAFAPPRVVEQHFQPPPRPIEPEAIQFLAASAPTGTAAAITASTATSHSLPRSQIPSTTATTLAIEAEETKPEIDERPIATDTKDTMSSNSSSFEFDFDAPFDISDAVPLPPLFQSFLDQYDASLTNSPNVDDDDMKHAHSSRKNSRSGEVTMTTDETKDDTIEDDACPGDYDDEEPTALSKDKLPCPECDFSSVSCALPMPWRPPSIENNVPAKDVWVSQKAWAKLCSHPLFNQCNVDELCTELRDRTRCSDDGRLVISKMDVCQVFRSIPDRVRLRERQQEMTATSGGA